MTARAASIGLTEPIAPDNQAAAEIEGWIALPQIGSRLADLVVLG